MSGICGVVRLDGGAVDPRAVSALAAAAPHRGPDGVRTLSAEGGSFARLAFVARPDDARDLQPVISKDGGLLLVADARLDNRRELGGALRESVPVDDGATDAELILAALRVWGDRGVDKLLGDFAFAAWFVPDRRLLLARDPLGTRGLVFTTDGRRCAFASEPGQLLDLPGLAPRIDPLSVAQFLSRQHLDDERTFFVPIENCPAAQALSIDESGVSRRRYWEVDPDRRIRLPSDGEYAEQFVSLLEEATAARIGSAEQVGVSLSGGLDSALVAAVAAKLCGERGDRGPRSFSYVFDEVTRCDERAWIEPVVSATGVDPTYLVADGDWTLREPGTWPVFRGEIWSDAYVRLPIRVATAARAGGCRVLLNGQHGDALFLSGCYWLADLIHDGRWRELGRALSRHRREIDLREDVMVHGLRQLVPPRWRRTLRRLRRRSPDGRPLLSDELKRSLATAPANGEDALEDRYPGPGQFVRLRTLTAGVWSQGLAASRGFHNRFGLEVESPYRDLRLIEFVLALPADQLGVPWRDRRIQRNALRQLGLTAVAERRGKANFDPLLVRGLAAEEVETVRSLLRSPQCVERGYVRPEWLTGRLEALDRGELRTGDALYELWLCLALELWLRHPDIRRLP